MLPVRALRHSPFLTVLAILLLCAGMGRAQLTYFNSTFGSTPAGTVLNGHASVTGGVAQLVPASTSQQGSLVVNNFTGSAGVTLFDVSFDVFTGNAANPADPADGYCFAWGAVSGSFGEDGPAGFTGLVVSFDYYVNAGEPGREVTVKWNGTQIGSVLYDAYTASTVPVHIRMRHGGYLDIWHNGNRLFTGLELPGFPALTGVASPSWGFGARTGGSTGKVTLDNLVITPQAVSVSNTAASGAGSLRQAIADAQSTYPGPNQIHFASSLNGQTISLGGSALNVNSQTLVIDASTLANGITVSAGRTSRILGVEATASLLLNRLTLADGYNLATVSGISIDGWLEMWDSTVTNCLCYSFATVRINSGMLAANRCTFSSNVATSGSAIAWLGSSVGSLKHCTISGNESTSGFGVIHISQATCEMEHCTIAGNQAANHGGGVYLQNSGVVKPRFCIIAGNTAPIGPDMLPNTGTMTSLGGNIIGNNQDSGIVAGLPNAAGDYVGSSTALLDAGLGALASNGGYTRTMRLSPTSPAREKAVGSSMTLDQRLLGPVGTPDCGACEYRLGLMADQTIPEDSVGPQLIAVASGAVITASSLNTALVPPSGLAVTGGGASRTITATPLADQAGTSVITITDSASGDTQTYTLTVVPKNDPPSFRKGADLRVPSGTTSAQTYSGWASSMSAGPANEADQSLLWLVSASQPSLFAAQPALSADGTLTFTPASGASGAATVTVQLKDSGGTANAGSDVSAAQTFTITIGDELPRFYSALDGLIPAGSAAYGHASAESTGLRLVSSAGGQMGSLIVQNFTGSTPVTVFDIAADVYTGEAANPGLPADGWCVAVGDVPQAAFAEEGPGDFTGLVVSFDYYINAPDTAREVTVKWNGSQIATVPYDAYRHNATSPVHIRLRNGGLLDVWHNGIRLFNGLPLPGFNQLIAPRWGFGARTGGLTAKVRLESLAINPQPFIVTTAAASGSGSLQGQLDRAATETAAGYAGPNQIHFASALNGQTLPVPTGGLYVDNHTVAIDASMLASGLTVSGNNADVLLTTNNNAVSLYMNRLHLTAGRAFDTGDSPAIQISGSLEMRDCTISNCVGIGPGGGIQCQDECHVLATNCSFYGNSGSAGGAVYLEEGTAAFDHCTFAGNTGGAIRAAGGAVSLSHCTVSANIGGGVFIASAASLNLARSIVAGNLAAARPDITMLSTSLTLTGPSIVGVADTGALTPGLPNAQGSFIGTTASPLSPGLSALGNYGGFTQTMCLLSGSPARDAATASTRTTDQRGKPLLGVPDIGAVEAQLSSLSAVTFLEDHTLDVPFTAGSVGTLTLTSDNITLFHEGDMVVTNDGSLHIYLQPEEDTSGVAEITLTDTGTGENVSFIATVVAVNDAPSFTAGPSLSHYSGNTALQTQSQWARNITPGPNENSQSVSFTATTDSPGFFTTQPAISPAGVLTYAVAQSSIGSATVRVRLVDDGGTENGGADSSAESAFTITSAYGLAEPLDSFLSSGSQLLGDAVWNSSSYVRLVSATPSQQGSYTVGPFASPEVVSVFDVLAFVYTGQASGTAGEGWSFALGDITSSFGEDGPSSFAGLVVSFDYRQDGDEPAKQVSVWWQGVKVGAANYDYSYLGGASSSVRLRVRNGGLLDVWHIGDPIIDGMQLPNWTGLVQPRWGFGARTGPDHVSEVRLDYLAINPQPFVVTSAATSGPGSLVEALSLAAASPGGDQIHFASSLDGATIKPGITMSVDYVAVDASMLPQGITIDAENQRQHFTTVSRGYLLLLRQLNLINGRAAGSQQGGAIGSNGALRLEDCSFSGCSAEGLGGAVSMTSTRTFAARRCTFSNNSGSYGGAFFGGSSATATFDHCTFSGNSATEGRGGSLAAASCGMKLTHCTVVNSSAATGGGGVAMETGGSLLLRDCVIAANAAADSADVYQTGGTLTVSGNNFIGSVSGAAAISLPPGLPNAGGQYVGSAISPIDPRLGALGSYGGFTKTIPLRAGSLALDAASSSTITTDQRGYPIVGLPDSGAYEAGTHDEFSIWAAETSGSSIPLDATADDDADGQNNLAEYAFRADPLNGSSNGGLAWLADGSVTYPWHPMADGLRYVLQSSSNLADWETISELRVVSGSTQLTGPAATALNSATGTATVILPAPAEDRCFFRVNVTAE